jgi:hypothetical protein
VFFNRFTSVPGQYAIIVKGLRTMLRLVSARMARESGTSPEEIRMLPSDDTGVIPVDESLGILGAARMRIGNALGIAVSALLKRLKGRPVEKSSLGHEAAMILSVMPLFPSALVHAVVAGLLRTPIIGCRPA